MTDKQKNLATIGSGIGFLAGIYLAYTQDKNFWYYAGYAVGLSIVGGIAGDVVARMMGEGATEIKTA